MMPIPYSDAKLNADEAFKQKAALQQMQDLLERVAVGKKYRTLTKSDRRTLNQEGYAQDLVDNLVLITQRIPSSGLDSKTYQDQVQTGFTISAFDPSLYANSTIWRHLRHTHQGCCAFCESFLESSGAGLVLSLRPQSIVFEQHTTIRSPYWQRAYAQNNLYLVCPACGEQHKSAYFPVQGGRKTDPAEEQAWLLAPYSEQPRDFIRFNPLNGQAYPFDRVQAFYQATNQATLAPDSASISAMLWKNPSAIPLQDDGKGNALSSAKLNQDFLAWLAHNADRFPRGQANIDCLGLNRPSLLASRRIQALALRAQFASQALPSTDPQMLASTVQTLLGEQLQYRSFNLDVIQHCLAQLVGASKTETTSTTDNNDIATTEGTLLPASVDGANEPAPDPISVLRPQANSWPKPGFPLWLLSSLIYMMFENELQIGDKRRLVHLSADDSTYGADNPEKSLFIAIDWWNDANKVIKVKSKNHIWETSFQELAASRPLEVRSLFANNHLWVEGEFPPLV